jgi:putative Holliday junction resolvase
MKLLGIDYGRRRIGTAVTDADGTTIRGLTVIDRTKDRDCITPLLELLEQESAERIVVGLPLGSRDEETAMSAEVRRFAAELGARSGLPVSFVDESFTSVRAQEHARSRKRKQRRDKATVDRIAACLILEAYQRIREAEEWGR